MIRTSSSLDMKADLLGLLVALNMTSYFGIFLDLQFVILFLHMHSTLVLTKELIFRYNH